MAQKVGGESSSSTVVRTFLIADVRGYSRFTKERGDAAAAVLAKRFADLARDAVEARNGQVIELRGDEALAVFESSEQAIRAAVEFQATCMEETESDPAFPLLVGIGIDSGEAVPVEDGYRGVALNMAARLCSRARAGQILLTPTVVDAVRTMDAEIRFVALGPDNFKGFEHPVDVMEAVGSASFSPRPAPLAVGPEVDRGMPPELDIFTPLVDREHEMRWLRGTWRQVRRGQPRLLFVSGPALIGKTRLAAEIASHVHADGGAVHYAGPGGAAAALALSAIRATLAASEPTLLVLDGVDVAGPPVAHELMSWLQEASQKPVLLLALVQDAAASAELSKVIERVDERRDRHRVLAPFDLDGVRGIVHLYAAEDTPDAPVESMARASRGVPGRVHEVASEWARSEASRRLVAAAEFLAAGRDRHASDLEFANNVIGLKLGRLYGVEGRDVLSAETCPYKGLAQFQTDDSAFFFGRERLVGELAARTVQAGLVGVVGASGSGKSSVVSAGLLPSLRSALLPGSDRWQQAMLRPGERPLDELRSTLQRSVGPTVTTLEGAANAMDSEARLVLVVDQFEELFSICSDEGERSSFIGQLTAATGRPDRFVVIAVIRDDFYGRCAPYIEFAALLGANHVLIPPMVREELRRAIELPARRTGLRVESGLVDALLEEAADEPGALPLLSTALVELWQARSGGWMRLETHQRTGGVRGAVARLAEESFSRLEGSEREAARRVLMRLAGGGEGDAVTRRRAPISEFDLDRDPAAAAALARFTEDRLVTRSEFTVEVAHEALLREWPRLREWLAEDVQGRRLRAHLTEASKQWEGSGREPGELYRGARLSAALDWATLHGRELNVLEREFLGAARDASEREAARQRRTNRRLRGLLVGTAVFLIIALVAGALAFVQRSRAQHSATVALSQSLGAQAVSGTQLDTSLLLGLEGVKLDDSLQTRSDLLKALLHSPQATAVLHVGRIAAPPQAIALSPDGRTLAVLNGNGELWFYSTATRRPIGAPVRNVPWQFLWAPQFTPDGADLAVQRGPGVELIDVRTHRVVRTVRIQQDPSAVTSPVMLSPDGRILHLQLGSVIQSWDVSTGRPVARAQVRGLGNQMVAIAGGSGQVVDLTTAAGGRIQVRDGMTLAIERSFPVPLPDRSTFPSYTLAVSPNARTAVYAANTGSDISLRFVDLRSGRVTVGSGGEAGGGLVAVSPDGRTAVSVDLDHVDISVWDVASATVVETLSGHSGLIRGVAFDDSGRTLYSAGLDGNVFAWDLSGRHGFERSFTVSPGSFTRLGIGHPYTYFSGSSVGSIAVADAPKQFVSTGSSSGGEVNIVNVTTGRVITRVRVAGRVAGISSVSYAEVSRDGTELLVSPGPLSTGDITLWRLRPGPPKLVRTFSGLTATLRTDRSGAATGFWNAPWATLSPDGKWIAGVDRHVNGTSHLLEWSAVTGKKRAPSLDLTWKPTEGPVSENVVYNSDGALIATSVMGDRIAVVNARTLKLVRTLRDPHGVSFVAFSPTNSHLLAEASSDVGLVRLWDVSTGRQIAETTASSLAGLWSTAFDPSGRMLITTGLDGVARLWSVPDLHQIGTDLPGRQDFHGVAAFTGRGTGTTAVTVYGDQAFAYPASLQAWERQACVVAGRNLTKAEWALYLGSRPYRKACPALPNR